MEVNAIPAILNYKRPDLVQAVIDQLQDAPLIIVAENGCDLYEYKSRARIAQLQFPHNNYFSGGWNRTMRIVADALHQTEWVWMLNSDVTGVSISMLEDLCDDGLETAEALAISPAFNSPHRHMQPQSNRRLRRVSWIDWTAPLVHVRRFIEAGMFDEQFAGYGADLDLAWRAKQLDHAFYVDDRLTFTHLGSQTAISTENINAMCNVARMDELLRAKYNVSDWQHFISKLEAR